MIFISLGRYSARFYGHSKLMKNNCENYKFKLRFYAPFALTSPFVSAEST